MNSPDPSKVTIEPFDLTGRMRIYDGNPENWNTPVQVSLGLSIWSFSLAEIDRQSFAQLERILGAECFQIILAAQGYSHPSHPFKIYRGQDGLPLRYNFRISQDSSTYELMIISFGEFQPNRWIAHIEGIWHVRQTQNSLNTSMVIPTPTSNFLNH